MYKSYDDFRDLVKTFKKLGLRISSHKEILFLAGIIYFVGDLNIDQNITSNDMQTFYANHYLKEICGISKQIPLENYEKISKEPLTLLIVKDSLNQIFSGRNNYENSNNLVENLKILLKETELAHQKENPSNYISNFHSFSEKTINEIEENGFSIVENFLTKDALNALILATKEISIHEKEKGTAYMYGTADKSQRIYNLISKNKLYRDLITAPYLVKICNRLFDRPTYHNKFGLSSCAANILPPGSKPMPWHLDSAVPDPIPPWMIRLIAVVNLDDFTKTNGSTTCVPKSHKMLRRPNKNDSKYFDNEIMLTAPAGSLIIWDGLLWHRTSENNSQKERTSIIISFAASFFMEICGEEEHLTVVPDSIKNGNEELIKRMIGSGRAIKSGAQTISEEIVNKNYF